MVRKPLFVTWGLALCVTGALMSTGCKSAGWSLPGSKLLGWNKQNTTLASNDPIKPPSQLDIPGPADTEIASAETVSGTGYPSDPGYGNPYGAGAGAAVAANGPASGPSNWSPDSPAAGANPYGAPASTYQPPANPYAAPAQPPAQEQFVASQQNPYGAPGASQFGPPAGTDWNPQATANPYVAQAANDVGAPGDFQTGGQVAANADYANPVTGSPSYPTTDYPPSYPVGNASATMPASPYQDAVAKAPPATPPYSGVASDFQPTDGVGAPPVSSFGNQAVARADSSFGATKRPPATGSAGDVIPAPANLTASRGRYAPGSTGFGGGTVVADQRGAPARSGSNFAPVESDNSFEPNGGSFSPSSNYR